MPDVDARLRAALGGDPPAGVAALDEPARAELTALIERARRRQSASLAQAFEVALKSVPLPARKLVRKMLLG